MHFNANRERRLQAYSFEMCRYFRERPKFRFAIICYDSEDFVLWKTGVTSALFKLNIDLSKLKIAQQVRCISYISHNGFLENRSRYVRREVKRFSRISQTFD